MSEANTNSFTARLKDNSFPDSIQNQVYLDEVKPRFRFREKPIYDAIKRVFDIVFSLTAITVLLPLMIIISIIIMIDDFGNPIFIQKRIGKNGKEFWMIKFRSMYKNAEDKREELMHKNEADGPIFKIKDDPRVTRVGKYIRRMSLDEILQFFNVLQGSMAIIGPRPFVTYEQEKFNKYQSQRLYVKPGLSCYWQIYGRSDTSFEKLIEYDLKYIMERGLITDIKIIILTIMAIIQSQGAY